jgi:hypothetical protein
VGLIDLVEINYKWHSLVDTAVNRPVRLNAGNLLFVKGTFGFRRRIFLHGIT